MYKSAGYCKKVADEINIFKDMLWKGFARVFPTADVYPVILHFHVWGILFSEDERRDILDEDADVENGVAFWRWCPVGVTRNLNKAVSLKKTGIKTSI